MNIGGTDFARAFEREGEAGRNRCSSKMASKLRRDLPGILRTRLIVRQETCGVARVAREVEGFLCVLND